MTNLLANFFEEKPPTIPKWILWVVYIYDLSIEKRRIVGRYVKKMLPVRCFSRSAYSRTTALRCLSLRAQMSLPAVQAPI